MPWWQVSGFLVIFAPLNAGSAGQSAHFSGVRDGAHVILATEVAAQHPSDAEGLDSVDAHIRQIQLYWRQYEREASLILFDVSNNQALRPGTADRVEELMHSICQQVA
jgi:hypothetical protein